MSELDQYNYHLPPELIAQSPLPQRSDARLMVVRRWQGTLEHLHIRDLPDILSSGNCLVLNDTKVIAARLVGYRTETGGRWEGLYLSEDDQRRWRLLSKTRGKLAPGDSLTLLDRHARDDVQLKLLAKLDGGMWAARVESDEPTLELLDRVGRVPLPHYIRGGEMVSSDRQSYQTVFAEKPGAVAAPTAGLHFTQSLLDELESRGVVLCRATLHVGMGTFRPITAGRLSEHAMHSEWGCIESEVVRAIEQCRAAGGRIVAVGSTSVRVLETAAAGGELVPWSGPSELFIRPPYQMRVVDALLTNFHLPRTTLLVLVRTFGGDELIKRAYEEATRDRYRFYSYGDAMLIL